MSAAPKRERTDPNVLLLCPKCGKRLPLSGSLAMLGTTGVYCRGCRRTIQVSMDMGEDEENTSDPHDE